MEHIVEYNFDNFSINYIENKLDYNYIQFTKLTDNYDEFRKNSNEVLINSNSRIRNELKRKIHLYLVSYPDWFKKRYLYLPGGMKTKDNMKIKLIGCSIESIILALRILDEEINKWILKPIDLMEIF